MPTGSGWAATTVNWYIFLSRQAPSSLQWLDPDDAIKQQLRREVSRYLRTVQPTWLRLGSVTALHLFQWFQNHRFCGCCGAPMKPDGKELAMRCTNDKCHAVTYPAISPAIIVGIVNNGKTC